MLVQVARKSEHSEQSWSSEVQKQDKHQATKQDAGYSIACGGLRTKGFLKQSRNHYPLISVITVVLNGGNYLEQTIRSVLEQTYANVEYIIIDGGSNDNTLDVIHQYEHAIDYWISEPDDGLYDAMNKGISLSNGDIIGLINSDDWYESGVFEAIASETSYRTITFGKLVSHTTDGRRLLHDVQIPKRKEEMRISKVHPTVFMSRDIYEEIGRFDTAYKISADFDLLVRALSVNPKFVKLSRVVAHFRGGGISHGGSGLTEVQAIAKKHDFSQFSKQRIRFRLWLNPVKSRLRQQLWLIRFKDYLVRAVNIGRSSLTKKSRVRDLDK